ncbi:MAG: EAL domain-containing protein [Acidimicrobiales bacterium]
MSEQLVEPQESGELSHEELRALCVETLLSCPEERVYFKDRAGRRILVSAGSLAGLAMGGRIEDVVGKTNEDLFVGEFADIANSDDRQVLESGETIVCKVRYVSLAGRNMWIQTTKMPLKDRAGRIIGTFGITKDMTAQVEAERALEHQALHDPLTGLANRALLLDRLEQALHASARRETRPAVLFLDLDHFKAVNDASGHSAGDQLLVAVADRIQAVVRASDTVARLGGDEFVVLCDDRAEPLEDSLAVAKRVVACLEPEFVVGGREAFVSASIGVAPAGTGDNAEGLLSRADQAMYRAKKLGRGRIEVYDPDVDCLFTRHAELSTALHHALREDQLHVAYQPVVDLGANCLVSREALLRWQHPKFGNVTPAEFIPLAEESTLIVEIGRWVLRQACVDCVRWRSEDDAEVGVAVNVSGRQLESGTFETDVAAVLEETGLQPGALTLEVTETLLMAGRAESRSTLERIRATGVRVAVDDFGTGYSSLSWLARLPLDVMKVDRSFIASLGLAAHESAIVEAMIHLAHTLGLAVVAEGVETDLQLSKLTSLGCDSAQGYLLGYPAALRASA